MRNYKTDVALAVTIIAAAATVISLTSHRISSSVGEEDENLSGISAALHTTVENGVVEENADIDEQIVSYSTNLNTNSVYDSAEIEEGQYVTFAESSVAIIVDGDMSAVCGKDLINVTKGNSLADGESAEKNNLYVITEENSGFFAESSAEFFVKGGYEITESIEE